MTVIDPNDSGAAAGNQALLDAGIVLYRAVTIEMIRRQVEQDARRGIERRREVNLVGGALDDIVALRLRRNER